MKQLHLCRFYFINCVGIALGNNNLGLNLFMIIPTWFYVNKSGIKVNRNVNF